MSGGREPPPPALLEPVGAHNSVVGADQGFRAPSGDQKSVRDVCVAEMVVLSAGPADATGLWVPNIRSCALTRHDALASWGPMCRILYRLLVSLARLAVHS